MLGTIVGFLISTPMIKKFGARNSILIGLAGSALFAGIRCLAPENIVMYAVTGALGSGIQIPLCVYMELLPDMQLITMSTNMIRRWLQFHPEQ